MKAADSHPADPADAGGAQNRSGIDRGRSLDSGLAWLATEYQVTFVGSSGSVPDLFRPRSIILITLHLFFKGPSNSFPLSSTLGKRSL